MAQIIYAGSIYGESFSLQGFTSGSIILDPPVAYIWEYRLFVHWFTETFYEEDRFIPGKLFAAQEVRLGLTAVCPVDVSYHLQLLPPKGVPCKTNL
jgi:hypothetical protein